MPFLGSVYQIFGLYPEIYYGMISAELAEQHKGWNKRKTKNQKQKRNCISFKIKNDNTLLAL